MLSLTLFALLAQAPPGDEAQIRRVVESFRQAVEAEKPDELQRLFWPEATVFEHGAVDRGAQAFVREHMVPHFREMDFKWTSETNEGRSEGPLAFVAQQATLEVRRGVDPPSTTDNTFTFVLRKKDAQWRISHLHWSLKTRPTDPAAKPATKP